MLKYFFGNFLTPKKLGEMIQFLMGDSTITPPKFNSSTLKEKEDIRKRIRLPFGANGNFFRGELFHFQGVTNWDDPPSTIAINEFARCCFQTAVLLFHP